MHFAAGRATAWLNHTYGGLVELSVTRPVHETRTSWMFACRTLTQPGYPGTPMLAASVVVPKDGSSPFHPSASDPLADLEAAAAPDVAARVTNQARRINARGCVVAVHSALNASPSTPLPWQPSHEAPGWWDRLCRRYFPAFERLPAADWDSVIRAMSEPGPETRGVVWVRRELGGVEATGNLVYAHNNKGQIVFLDAQVGGLAKLDTSGVRELIFVRGMPERPHTRWPWEEEAHDFRSALDKARLWLEQTYHGDVELIEPSTQDEIRRGWVFACNTKRYVSDQRWQDAMLDATLVVPKEASAPFGLPNSAPWAWLGRWDAGDRPGSRAFPEPPPPGPASSFTSTLDRLGSVLSTSEHADWNSALNALRGLPTDARAVVWIRRVDSRGREAVGWLLNAVHTARGVALIDGSSNEVSPLESPDIRSLHVIRYR